MAFIKRTTEYKANVTEDDIRAKLKTLSPMLQQEYLENILRRMDVSPEVRLLASRKVVELYVGRGLWSNAAKVMESAAMGFINPNTKRDIYKQAGILYVKAGNFMTADDCFRRAVDNAMDKEKPFLKKEDINHKYPPRDRGVVEKCNFCEDRIGDGLQPACVEACKYDALIFGDLNDPKDPKSKAMRDLLRKHYTIRRKPGLGTDPQVYYII